MIRKIVVGLLACLTLPVAVQAAQAAVDTDCTATGTTVSITGKDVPTGKVRIFGTATATLAVDVPDFCTDPYTVSVPRLGVNLTRAGGDAVVPVTVSDALLSNIDAGVPVNGSLTYRENVLVDPEPGESKSFQVTPLRYTKWTPTNAYYESGFTAGDTINARATLSVADWDSDLLVTYPNRVTRLVVRKVADAWPSIGHGSIVKGDLAGVSRTTKVLGSVDDPDTETVVLRFTYSGNTKAAPSVSVGDAVKVLAADE
jgi:hypothetical protein